MEHYAGIDVSLEFSSVCIVDVNGQTLKEAKVTSEPDALMAFLGEAGFSVTRIGLEAGPLSQWSLSQIGLYAVTVIKDLHICFRLGHVAFWRNAVS